MTRIVTLVREKARLIHAAKSRHLLWEWRVHRFKIWKRHDKIGILERLSKLLTSRHFWSKWWITH